MTRTIESRPAAARPAGRFRTLWWWEGAALRDHLSRLSAQDLALRFHGGVSAQVLDRFCRDPREPGRDVIGWFHDGALRGAAELRMVGDVAEAAFTVEEPWRRMGVGAELMRRALRRARNRGARELIVHTARGNRPMMRLARRFDAELEADFNEVEGRVAAPGADPASLLFDVAEEEAGLVAALWESQRETTIGFMQALASLAGAAARPPARA